MRDLDEIVDLYALLNPRPPKPGAVKCGVRTDLDVVVDLNNPELWDFFVAILHKFEPETVCSDDRTPVNNHA